VTGIKITTGTVRVAAYANSLVRISHSLEGTSQRRQLPG
jgi:hypothetical protein